MRWKETGYVYGSPHAAAMVARMLKTRQATA
jgi:hypothetical protein